MKCSTNWAGLMQAPAWPRFFVIMLPWKPLTWGIEPHFEVEQVCQVSFCWCFFCSWSSCCSGDMPSDGGEKSEPQIDCNLKGCYKFKKCVNFALHIITRARLAPIAEIESTFRSSIKQLGVLSQNCLAVSPIKTCYALLPTSPPRCFQVSLVSYLQDHIYLREERV